MGPETKPRTKVKNESLFCCGLLANSALFPGCVQPPENFFLLKNNAVTFLGIS